MNHFSKFSKVDSQPLNKCYKTMIASSDDQYVYITLQTDYRQKVCQQNTKSILYTVCVNETPINVQIDSGTNISIFDEKQVWNVSQYMLLTKFFIYI